MSASVPKPISAAPVVTGVVADHEKDLVHSAVVADSGANANEEGTFMVNGRLIFMVNTRLIFMVNAVLIFMVKSGLIRPSRRIDRAKPAD